MYRPFLALLACVTVGACARTATPADAPAPASTPAAAATRAPDSSSTASAAAARMSPAPATTALVLPDTGVEREFRGAYTRGFEASWFAPCGAPRDDALWWVTLTEPARLERDSLLAALTQASTGALAVRWRGTISPRMPAGQMGRGTRYLLVTQVIEVRPLPPEGACTTRSAIRTNRY